MVLFLQSRRLVRAEDLAHHFEVSLRTIYRDIAALGEAGVPISGEAGVGYTLVKGYHLPPVLFTAEEAAALFVGGEMVKRFADPVLQAAADSALLKIRSVLPAERQEELLRLERATVIGSMPRPDVGLRREVLRPIQQALVSRRVLAITYRARARTDDTVREVEPLGVFFAGGAWYLVAWCRLRDEVRHFRLDRIRSIEPRHEQFVPREAEFSLRAHLDQIESGAPTIEVTLRTTPEALERVRAESYRGVLSERTDGAQVEVRLSTYSLDWCARWVLSFAGEVGAVAPPALREKVRTLGVAAAEAHR